ncbi:DUF2125 domain-containing protein [Rhodobacteraceae bacterium 2CG4]|uniref:DUF2125 domain-containing protein n=1 Tax=Halovulum marinum TaxID=2662447 RepID=A0A6L5Z7H5_9RHOB|nr:DUF2125 domain-containing protein [Halovulum marinum]MSU92110.1 DUF2125 domain-containing protein [Halovulum marinum]
MMRRLLFIVLAAALLWSGYWWVGQSAQKAAIDGWLEAQRQRGRVAEAGAVRVRGFPNRFDTTLTEVTLVDPASGLSWTAPFFRIYALSYAPNHVIAAWPGSQTLSGPFGRLRIDSREMMASVRFRASTALALAEARAELSGLRISADAGWTAGLADGQAALRATPEAETGDGSGANAPNRYQLFLRASALDLPEALRRRLDPEGDLPDTIGAARLRATVTLDRPLDRRLADGAAPAVTALEIDEAEVGWGPLRLAASGRLKADADGLAAGSIALEALEWRQQLRMARRSGLMPPPADAWAERLLAASETTAQQSAETDLNMTLRFRGGRTWIGPIPVGPAPRLNAGAPPPA